MIKLRIVCPSSEDADHLTLKLLTHHHSRIVKTVTVIGFSNKLTNFRAVPRLTVITTNYSETAKIIKDADAGVVIEKTAPVTKVGYWLLYRKLYTDPPKENNYEK